MTFMPVIGSLLCVGLCWADEAWLYQWRMSASVEQQFLHIVLFGLSQGALLMWMIRNLFRFTNPGTWFIQFICCSVASACVIHQLKVLRPQHGEMAAVLGAARTSIHAWRFFLFKEEYASLTQQQQLSPILDLAAVDVVAAILAVCVMHWWYNYRWYHCTLILVLMMVGLHVYFQVPTPDALWVQQLWQAAYNQWLGPDHGPFTEPTPIHNATTAAQ